ncbi:hypothetical protein KP509_24G003100 [Ceratopteris richardii]|uniref:Uncharacterized protein n=1 Tax=Ceratopteris richardii TaxID=49495 RepID=A0A8T2RSW0_CERRI|nr:hypothetical protein KP509_24G003100 [Ceratopteris richardii]
MQIPVSKPASAGNEDTEDIQSSKQLDAKASRLLKAAQRASETAKRAYAVGIETTQVRARQVSDVVLENANRATDSSKAFLSKVASKAGHYAGKAQTKASKYKANVSRAIQLPKDQEGEHVGFPLSIFLWCSTMCGRSKPQPKPLPHQDRELQPEESEGEEFSVEFLAITADEYASALEDDAAKLEEEIAAKEKKNAPSKSTTPTPAPTPTSATTPAHTSTTTPPTAPSSRANAIPAKPAT